METAIDNEQTSDTHLMIRYRDGDIDAFNELYARHKSSLYRFMVNSCSTDAIAAELFQDVWAKVVNGRHGYSSSSPFAGWLYRIARNRLIDYYRANKKDKVTTSLDLDNANHVTQLQAPLQPDELAELATRKNALSAALSTLPDEQREVVLLRHIAGFGVQEISELVNENTETVKSRLRYAFTKLRKQLRML